MDVAETHSLDAYGLKFFDCMVEIDTHMYIHAVCVGLI